MRNELDDLAVAEMSREKQMVPSLEREHDQADRNRENQRTFQGEGQHDEA